MTTPSPPNDANSTNRRRIRNPSSRCRQPQMAGGDVQESRFVEPLTMPTCDQSLHPDQDQARAFVPMHLGKLQNRGSGDVPCQGAGAHLQRSIKFLD
ncbi:unnamed protein product [Urochloa humidicola]